MSATTAPVRRAAADALRRLSATAVGMGGGVVLSILVARALGPEEMGSYALALMVVSAVQTLAGFGLARTTLKFTAAGHGTGADDLPGGAAAALAATAPLLAAVFGDPRLLVLLPLGSGILLCGLLSGVLESALEGRSRFDFLARAALWLTPVHLVATLTALAVGAGAPGVILAQVAFGAVNLAVLAVLARRAGLVAWRPPPPDAVLRRRMLRFARHGYWLSLLTFVVHDRVEVLVLGALATPEAVSYYSVALGAAEAAMGLGPYIVASVFFPILVAAWTGGDPRLANARYAQCLRYLALLAAPLALGGVAVAPAGVAVLFGPDYAPAVPVLRLTLLSATAIALAQGPMSVLMAVERQDWLLRVRGALAVANLGLDVVLVPRFSALGAAGANLAVAVAEVLLLAVVAWRLVGARPAPAAGVPFVAAGLAALAAALVVGDRTDPLSLAAGILVAAPIYAAALLAGRFFGPQDAAVLGRFGPAPTPAPQHQTG